MSITKATASACRVSGNIGLPLGPDGFANLSAEYSESDITSRGHPRPDAAAFGAIVGNDIIPLGGLGQRWGDPDVEALKFAVNAGLDVSDTLEVYGFATYMDNTTTSDFFYRGPVVDAGAARRPRRAHDAADRQRRERPAGSTRRSRWSTSIVARALDPNDYLVAGCVEPERLRAAQPDLHGVPRWI